MGRTEEIVADWAAVARAIASPALKDRMSPGAEPCYGALTVTQASRAPTPVALSPGCLARQPASCIREQGMLHRLGPMTLAATVRPRIVTLRPEHGPDKGVMG